MKTATGQASRSTLLNRFTIRVILVILLLVSVVASAENEVPADAADGSIHWAYGSFLGTGWYKVSGDRKAFVLSLPPRWNYRPASLAEDGDRQIGIEFLFPLTLGLEQIDDFSNIISTQNLTTASFMPGVELAIPLDRNWVLRPYVMAGWGKELAGNESAWIYETGVKARYALPSGNGNWSWLNAVQFAGFSPNAGESSDMLNLMTGIENRQQLGDLAFNGNQLFVDWHFSYNRFSNPATFRRNGDPRIEVADFWEAAAAISFGDKRIKILGFKFDRLGLAYQISSDGEYRAIKLSLKSPFLQ